MRLLKAFPIVALLVGASVCAPVFAATELKELMYNGKPVNGYLGGHETFPAEFVDQLTCENGRAARDERNGCIILRSDGTGQWDNDRGGIGRPAPSAAIKWYVVADKTGTVTRVSDDARDVYFVIIEYQESYYAQKPGDLYAFQAVRFKDGSRVILHSKYRNLK